MWRRRRRIVVVICCLLYHSVCVPNFVMREWTKDKRISPSRRNWGRMSEIPIGEDHIIRFGSSIVDSTYHSLHIHCRSTLKTDMAFLFWEDRRHASQHRSSKPYGKPLGHQILTTPIARYIRSSNLHHLAPCHKVTTQRIRGWWGAIANGLLRPS